MVPSEDCRLAREVKLSTDSIVLLSTRTPIALQLESEVSDFSFGPFGPRVSEQFLNGTSAHNRPFQCHVGPRDLESEVRGRLTEAFECCKFVCS